MYCSNVVVGSSVACLVVAMFVEMLSTHKPLSAISDVAVLDKDGSCDVGVDVSTTFSFFFLRFFRSRLLNRRFLRVLLFSM